MGAMVMLCFLFYGLQEPAAAAIETRWSDLVKSAVGAAAAS
jgi:hypothetical protein